MLKRHFLRNWDSHETGTPNDMSALFWFGSDDILRL